MEPHPCRKNGGQLSILAHGNPPQSPISRNERLPAPNAEGSLSAEYTPGCDALRNRPDACRRSASIWSAAERETGTM